MIGSQLKNTTTTKKEEDTTRQQQQVEAINWTTLEKNYGSRRSNADANELVRNIVRQNNFTFSVFTRHLLSHKNEM